MATITLRGHFDGKQIILDEPFELTPNDQLLITILEPQPREENPPAKTRTYSDDALASTDDMTKEPGAQYGAKGGIGITREAVKAEIDKIADEHLGEIFEVIKRIEKRGVSKAQMDLLSSLQEIQIDGPEDFATNLDAYLNGEKELP